MKRSVNLAKLNSRVGAVTLICLGIIVYIVFNPIRGVNPFSSKIRVFGYYDDVQGLKRNAPVYVSGVEVGKVDSVDFLPAKSKANLKVVVLVETKVQHLLRADSQMKIISMGLLGDKFVQLVPGNPDLPEVTDGQELAGVLEENALANLAGISEQVSHLVQKADSLLSLAQSPSSSVGRLFREDKLYAEALKTVTELHQVASRLNQIEQDWNNKVLDPNTKKGVDSTVDSVRRIAEKVDKYVDKVDQVKFYLDLEGSKYEGTQYSGAADLRIVPDEDRYYMGGLEYFNVTSTATADDQLTFNAALGLRVLKTPVFFWGGMKRTYFATGLDVALFENTVGLTADLYKLDRPTAQFDLAAKYRVFKIFSLKGGVDDVMTTDRVWRGGLIVTYDDEDLSTILIKLRTGI